MDQVFKKSSIDSMCDKLEEIVTECKKHMDSIDGSAQNIQNAINQVPMESRTWGLTGKIDNFAQAVDIADVNTMKAKLKSCKTRVESIIREDESYADNTDQLGAQADAIKGVLEGMTSFLGSFSLTLDYSDYIEAFKTEKVNWQQSLEEAARMIQEVRDNCKGSEELSTIFSHDPVNLSTGNFVFDRTDLSLAGDHPFLFRRFYNAINDRSGSLGRDWNHNYEIRLEDVEDRKVLILEEGKEERFIRTASGMFTSLYQSNGTLAETEDGYCYRTTDQTAYYFDKEGYYLRQENLDGAITFLHYEQVENSRRLVKVERITGEYFVLSYSGEGYLAQVRDHSGRTVRYAMDGDHLSGVCTPRGHWYRYGYGVHGKLTTVQNARNITVVENTFDDQMRVIHQVFPDKTQMSFAYDDEERTIVQTERNGNEVTYVHDKIFRDIKHIYSDGEERFEYNKRNQKTLVVDKLGNKTQYGYDEKGNLTRVINALGVSSEFCYDAYNQPTYIAVGGTVKVRNHYDEQGNLIEAEDALGNTYRYEYQKPGLPERILQPDGSEICLEYDARGNVTKMSDASGGVTTYCYDHLNRVIETIDGNGNKTCFSYDAEDNITKVVNANGDARTYEYNESNKVTQIQDFNGSVTRREYNELNRPSKLIDELGRETTFLYDVMWNLARITEPNGAQTTFLYNEHNRLGRIRNANGDVIYYDYDALGNRTKMEDEEGNETFFTYDALGQLTKVIDPEGASLSYEYDSEGNLIKVTDALENEVLFGYDADGNLVTETGSMGEKRVYTYTVLGEIESVTDESGRRTVYEYERGGLLSRICHSDETTEEYKYDGNGNVCNYIDRRGHVLHYQYDALDQIVLIEGSDGGKKRYDYDSVGNVIHMTDGLGNVTNYEYSLTGQLTKVIDPLGNETEYSYNECDHLIQICQYGQEEGSGNLGMDTELQKARVQNQKERICRTTKYERDLMGNVLSVTDDAGQQETYEYGKVGQLLSKVDKEGYLTKYGYTGNGDVNHIQYADGREVKMGYNALRHLQEVQDWLGTTKIETDPLGRAKKVSYPDGKEVSYTFGQSGERESITYPNGKKVHYGYDKHLRLSSLQEGEKVITYGYNQMSDLVSKQFPNGTSTEYSHNSKGQISSLTHRDQEGIVDAYTYGYDILGNQISLEKQRRGLAEESGTYQYSYDPMGRLCGVTKDGTQQRSYGYDAFGNRTQMKEGNRVTTYSYSNLNQLVKKIDGENEERYQYDKRGNLLQIMKNHSTKQQYQYGALNRLEETVDHKGNVSRYQYNGLGHRVGKQIGKIQGNSQPSGIPQLPVEGRLDPMNKMNGQLFEAASHVDYVIDLTQNYHNLLQKHEDQEIQTFLWDGMAVGILGEQAEEDLYYFQDSIGSPIRLTGAQGAIRETYGYNEFGCAMYGNQNQLQPFGYTGYQVDTIAGSYYAQAREYLPSVGRFMGRDMRKGDQEDPFTLNEYNYCWNQPMNLVDADGAWPHILVGAIVGAVVNTVSYVATSVVTGNAKDISFRGVAASFAGGAASGATFAATGNTVLASAAGGAVESVVNDVGRTSWKTMAKNAVVNAGVDAAFAGVGSKAVKGLKKTKVVKKLTQKVVDNSKYIQKVNGLNRSYKGMLTRARNSWKNDKKLVDLTGKSIKNGIKGGLGEKLPQKLVKHLTKYNKLEEYLKALAAGQGQDFIDDIYLALCIG